MFNLFCTDTGLARTFNGVLIHRANDFWADQFRLSSQSSKSNLKMSVARMSLISCMAMFCPRQLRGPNPKG